MRQHLPQETYEADGVKSPETGEKLSISLLDAITIHWLLAIDRRLVNIVKTELATDLKSKRICQLVKQIAPNVDEWIARYSQADSISSVTSTLSSQSLPPTTLNNETPSLNAIIQRLERLESGTRGRVARRGRFTAPRPLRCGHCVYINRQLGANLDTQHTQQNW